MNMNEYITSPSMSMLTKVACNEIISFENTPLFDLKNEFITNYLIMVCLFKCHLTFLSIS